MASGGTRGRGGAGGEANSSGAVLLEQRTKPRLSDGRVDRLEVSRALFNLGSQRWCGGDHFGHWMGGGMIGIGGNVSSFDDGRRVDPKGWGATDGVKAARTATRIDWDQHGGDDGG